MVVVESPSGTTSTLLGFRPADQVYGGFGLFNKWPMMSVHFWGENPVGNWTLTVVNRSPDAEDSAELFDWTLKFYGTSQDPQPDIGLLKYRQVDKNGKYLLGDNSIAASSSEDEDVVQEDASEARGLQALAVHTKLTKEAIGLADESENEANEIAESVTVSTTAKSIDTTQSSLLQVEVGKEDSLEEVAETTEVTSTENVQENSEESSVSDDSINEPSEDKDGE